MYRFTTVSFVCFIKRGLQLHFGSEPVKILTTFFCMNRRSFTLDEFLQNINQKLRTGIRFTAFYNVIIRNVDEVLFSLSFTRTVYIITDTTKIEFESI